MANEVKEQMYLLEMIVEDVHVDEEGILDTLREQVETAELQLKQKNDVAKEVPKDPSIKDNITTNEVVEKEPVEPNPEPPKENPQPSKTEKKKKENEAKTKQKTNKRKAPVKILAQFLDFPAFEIKQKEFEKYTADVKPGSKSALSVHQGKSFLFSMTPKDMMDAIRKHPIVVQLHREESDNEPAHLIGVGRICLGQECLDTIALGNTPTIAVTTIQDEYSLTNIFGDETATVSLVIRLSCVGTSITTKFTYNQFDGNFKFTSGETPVKSDAPRNKPGIGQMGAIFHKDDVLGISAGPPPDCKLPPWAIPWRSFHEEISDARTCGSRRLFKEQAGKCYADDTFDLGEFNPGWTPCTAKVMKAKCPGGVCCGRLAESDYVPPEFGPSLPPEIKQLLPCGVSSYEVPFEEFGMNVNWGHPPRPKNDARQVEMRVCCTMGQSQPTGCPCMAAPVNISSSKVNQPPPLEDAGPHLKSAHVDRPETTFKRDFQYIPCPNSPDTPNAGNVTCGLEELLNQRHFKNLLQPSLTAPLCPPDSGQRPSLCTCPKVPTVVPPPAPRGVVRCECTNILTAMKPIELPYSCPRPQEPSEQTPTCPPCPPVPIKLPPPAPECPLATLLKESQDGRLPPSSTQLKQPTSSPHVTTTRPLTTETDAYDTTDADRTATSLPTDTVPKTKDSKQDQSSDRVSKKSKKGHKVLQDEVARSTTTTTYSHGSEPPTDRPLSKQSKNSSSSTSSTSPPKKKIRPKADEGRGSVYTPTRIAEPQEKELNIAYTPTAGKYPGFIIGHKNCIPIVPRVPKRMGWLWNIKDADGFMKPGRGWRPGSIQTNVMKVMDNVKTNGKTNPPIHQTSKQPVALAKTKSYEQQTRKVESSRQMANTSGEAPMALPSQRFPTLHVHKKHGLHYVSMIPPPKDNARYKNKVKRMNSRGDMVDSESDDSLPAQFRIDTKNPDGLFGNLDLYETDETSTFSEDSYQMEVIAPSSLRHRQPLPATNDMEVQVTENDFIRPTAEHKSQEGEPEVKKPGKQGKKKSSGASNKGKKAKGSVKHKKV